MDENTLIETRIIGPEEAKRYLETAEYPKQRRLKKFHVDEYAHYMREGVWKPNTVIKFNVVDDVLFLIDGQHRLAAIVETGLPQQFILVTEYVDSLDTLAHNYVWTDVGLARNNVDVTRALGLDEKFGTAAHRISKVRTAARIIRNGHRSVSHCTREDVLDRRSFEMDIEEWGLTACRYYALFDSKHIRNGMSKYMQMPTVMSVALPTMRYAPASVEAPAFWQSVFKNDGLRATSPEHALASLLQRTSPNVEGIDEFIRKVAGCWNAYFRHEPGHVKVYARNKMLPILIEGTPYTGKVPKIEPKETK